MVAPSVGQVGGHTAGTDEVVVHPQAGDGLLEAQDLLALSPAVEHHRHGAEVHAVGGQEQHVRSEAVHLAHQHADPLRPFGHLDAQQLLGRQREDELVEQRRGVVHARDVGGALHVGQLLAGLLHAGVEVADDGLGPRDRLAVELEHQAQHAVGRRVLGAHVHDHPLALALGRGRDVAGLLLGLGLGQAEHAVVAGQVHERLVERVELDRGVLAGLAPCGVNGHWTPP